MKKLLYFVAALGMLVLGTSCERDLAIFEYDDETAGVTFASEDQIFSMLPTDGNKILVEMVRGNIKGDVSIPVEITDYTEGVFTPEKSSFDFKDGENKAYLAFSYPSIENFGGETYEIDIKIAESALGHLSPNGIEVVTVQATRQLTEVSLGVGHFVDPVLYESEWDQEICTTEEAPSMFYLKDCFADGKNVIFNVNNGVFTIADAFDTGCVYSASYGNFGIRSAAIAFDAATRTITITGILCLPSVSYDFCPFGCTFTLPADFDVKKNFGI